MNSYTKKNQLAGKRIITYTKNSSVIEIINLIFIDIKALGNRAIPNEMIANNSAVDIMPNKERLLK